MASEAKRRRHKRNRGTLKRKAEFAKTAAKDDPAADPWKPMSRKGRGREHVEDDSDRLRVPLEVIVRG